MSDKNKIKLEIKEKEAAAKKKADEAAAKKKADEAAAKKKADEAAAKKKADEAAAKKKADEAAAAKKKADERIIEDLIKKNEDEFKKFEQLAENQMKSLIKSKENNEKRKKIVKNMNKLMKFF